MLEQSASDPLRPSVLIVGAGCVGQVFGRHLALGGAQVTFLVRPKYRAEAERGFALYPLNKRRPGAAPLRFAAHAVISTYAEVAERRFDQVYLTFSSSALQQADLAPLLAAVGDATLVSLQPDADDHALIERAGWARERLVCGGIALIAFHAPLPGQTRISSPGTAYWLPPLARSPFSGPRQRCAEVVTVLRRGGLPARTHADVPRLMAFPSAVGMTYLTALEGAGWSVPALRRGALLALCERGVREALAIVRQRVGRPPLGLGLAVYPWLAALGLWIAARVVPFPLLPYLERHFSKVAAQTHLIVGRLVLQGDAAGLETGALKRLLEAVTRSPSQHRGAEQSSVIP